VRVSSVTSPRRSRIVAEETRELILQAAEEEFAAHGYASARLEDIARRVEITRTAIIYHFGDKQSLYDAVLEAAFGALSERTHAALAAEEASEIERVELLVETWLEVVSVRPTLARLFLREVADAQREFRPEVKKLVEPMFAMVIEAVLSGQRAGTIRTVDPNHFVAILAGAIMWYATNAPLLHSSTGGANDQAATRAAFRAELMGVTRRLLASSEPGVST
jgi:TetR/AcrR family transcriptional regulator